MADNRAYLDYSRIDIAIWNEYSLRVTRPSSPFMPSDWFLEEYKLIQSKIDQVLTSQFQVRSWSVSLLTGFVLGVFATHTSPVALVAALPVIAIFQLQDKRQEWFRKTLSNRAADLESGINLLGLPTSGFSPSDMKRWASLRRYVPTLGAVPGTARVLIEEKMKGRWFLMRAETLFWVAQYTIVVLIISTHLATLRFGAIWQWLTPQILEIAVSR